VLDFRNPVLPPSDVWYDLELDRSLIEQSIAKQYHILPSEQDELRYSDWAKLVSGLMEDTPLGQIVMLRSEKDRDVIKKFSKQQRKLRSEWNVFRAKQAQQKTNRGKWAQDMKNLEKTLESIFGGGARGR
jgi:hypothetical protein